MDTVHTTFDLVPIVQTHYFLMHSGRLSPQWGALRITLGALIRIFGRKGFASVTLMDVELTPELIEIYDRYEEEYGETQRNFLRMDDYQRWSYVLSQASGGSRLLDVGIGVGQFIYAANLSPKVGSVVGVDKRAHSKLLVVSDDVDLVWSNAADLPFDDGEFTTVTCMECLEHLDDDTFEASLRELRRVTSGELFMTVPFDEPEPLTPGHLQHFDRKRIRSVFPDGEVTLLHRPYSDTPWALIRENHKARP